MRPAQQFVHSLAEQVTIPEVYRDFRRLCSAPDSTISDYAAVVNTDPALATRLIRIANTPFFGYSRAAHNLEQTISLIGVMQIHDVLIGSLVMRAFAGIPNELVNLSLFWENSVHCGILSRLIAKKCQLPASQRLFALGLFHDIGHLVMYAKQPELAQLALQQSLRQGVALFLVERKLFGFDYAQLGYELLRLWHLPGNFQEIIRHHVEPEKAQHYPVETAVVHLAYALPQLINGPIDTEEQKILVSPLASKLTRLNQNDLKPIRAEALKNCQDVLLALWPFAESPYKNDLVHQDQAYGEDF